MVRNMLRIKRLEYAACLAGGHLGEARNTCTRSVVLPDEIDALESEKTELEAFLAPSLKSLDDPLLMADMVVL